MRLDAIARGRARRYAQLAAFAAPFALVWFIVIIGGVGGKHVAQVVSNGGLAITAFAAAVSCVVTGVRAKGRYGLVWVLLGLGMLSWAVGQLIWDYYEAVLHRDVPFPSLADAGYLGEVPLVVAALVLLPSGTRSVAGRTRTVFDGLIVAAALLLMSWMLVLGTVFRSGSGSVLAQTLSLAYPISDVVTVTIVMYAILRARQTGRKIPVPLLLVGLGLVSLSVADSGFTYQTAAGTYYSGAPIDTGWFAGFLLILLASRAPAAADSDQMKESDVQRSMGLLLPYVAVVLATITTFVELARGATFDRFVSWDRSMIIALLVARQVLTLRENVSLTRDLEANVVEVRASEQRFEALVQHSSDVVTVMDRDGVIGYQSESVQRVFGYPAAELRAHKFTDLMSDEQAQAFVEAVERTISRPGDAVVIEVQLRHADGHVGDTEIAITNLLGDPTVGGVVLNSRDISERKALELELVHQARHDSLTALANRALFQERIDESLRQQNESTNGAVLFLDLDGFKEVNDSFGHANGDVLLTLVASRLRSCVRPRDLVARLGGDEFAILIDDSSGLVDAHALATRILASFSNPFTLDGRDVFISASIGIASADQTVKDSGQSVEESGQLLRNADLAMYRAKAAGGGTIEHYNPLLHTQLLERMHFEEDLRRALGRGELRLYYQPIMDLTTTQPVGFEALVRWQHPTAGLITPDRFIGIAERTGLIQPLGRWVLFEACRDMMIWRNRHPEYAELGVSVNLSARQFQNDDLVDDVINALAESGLPPTCLELEMTESVLFEHTEENIAQLTRLKELGVRLAIDDFGTGYSSLAYLHRFSVDVLKIDRTFIAQLTETGDTELVRSILQIGRSLHMVTIAEGIETDEQSELVAQMGCELGQGYLFARPLPASDVDGWLTATHLPASRRAG